MKQNLDWKSLEVDWEKFSDAEIASLLKVTRQSVSAARKRLDRPPSPAGHGGARRGSVGSTGALKKELLAGWLGLDESQREKVVAFVKRLKKA